MKVAVEAYGIVKTALDRSNAELVIPDGCTVESAIHELCQQQPSIRPLLKGVVFAVDDDIVPANTVLHDGATLALLPPVSGG